MNRGQKVVCVWDFQGVDKSKSSDPYWFTQVLNLPCKGCIYTIRAIEVNSHSSEYKAVLLEEITNPVGVWRGGVKAEGNFDVRMFRPAIDKSTDISIFTEMLNTKESVI